MEKEYSKITLEMAKKLKTVYDNDDFITGVYAEVYNSLEDQQKIIDFIDADDDVSHETVTILAMELSDAREGK